MQYCILTVYSIHDFYEFLNQPTFPFRSDVITDDDSVSLFGVDEDKMANISSVAA